MPRAKVKIPKDVTRLWTPSEESYSDEKIQRMYKKIFGEDISLQEVKRITDRTQKKMEAEYAKRTQIQRQASR